MGFRLNHLLLHLFAGPNHWHLDYKHCGGVKQSPIDIATNDVIIDKSHLKPFNFTGYDSEQNGNMSMVNNGHTGKAHVFARLFSLRFKPSGILLPSVLMRSTRLGLLVIY